MTEKNKPTESTRDFQEIRLFKQLPAASVAAVPELYVSACKTTIACDIAAAAAHFTQNLELNDILKAGINGGGALLYNVRWRDEDQILFC